MSIGSLFTKLPGILRFFRRNALSTLARRTLGFNLRRPFTAMLRREFRELGFREAQSITKIAFDAAAAARRLTRIGVRRVLRSLDIPILPIISGDPVFADRFSTSLTYEWFDQTTGLSGFNTAIIGTGGLPDLQELELLINENIREGLEGSSALLNLTDKSQISISIKQVISISAGF